MIKYIDGDLITMAKNGEFDVIIQGCNCFCQMGSGIAPQIKSAFPEAFEVDLETECGSEAKLGSMSYTKETIPTVCNLYSQFRYGGGRFGKMDLDYDALRSSLKLVKEKFSGKTIGSPKIGAGLAGGDWEIIEQIIEEELEGEDVTVVNYVP